MWGPCIKINTSEGHDQHKVVARFGLDAAAPGRILLLRTVRGGIGRQSPAGLWGKLRGEVFVTAKLVESSIRAAVRVAAGLTFSPYGSYVL